MTITGDWAFNPWAAGVSAALRSFLLANLLGVCYSAVLLVRRSRVEGVSPLSRWLGRLFVGAHLTSVALGLLIVALAFLYPDLDSAIFALFIILLPGLIGGISWLILLLAPTPDTQTPSILA